MRRLPDNVIKELGLTLADMHVGMSFPMDLVFYKRGDLIITNYDMIVDELKHDPDLSKRGMWLVWCKKGRKVNYFKASDELVCYETAFFNSQLINFENELTSSRN